MAFPTTVEAIYESGVLRLLEPVELEEGTRVAVTMAKMSQPPLNKTETRSPLEIVREIAALSVPGNGEETGSRDHDRILYGGPNGAR